MANTLSEWNRRTKFVLKEVHDLYQTGKTNFYANFDQYAQETLKPVFNQRLAWGKANNHKFSGNPLHKIVAMYVKAKNDATQAKTVEWEVDWDLLGSLLLSTADEGIVNEAGASKRAGGVGMDVQLPATRAGQAEVPRPKPDRITKAKPCAPAATNTPAAPSKAKPNAQAAPSTTSPPPRKTQHRAAKSGYKSKDKVGTTTDEDTLTAQRDSKGKQQAADNAKGEIPAAHVKGKSQEKDDDDTERKEANQKGKTSNRLEVSSSGKSAGTAGPRPASPSNPIKTIPPVVKPKHQDTSQDDGDDAKEDMPAPDEASEAEFIPEEVKPAATSTKKKKKRTPIFAIERTFTVFDPCGACASKDQPCLFTNDRVGAMTQGKLLACDHCHKIKKKCVGSADTAMALAEPLGDFAEMLYPPNADGTPGLPLGLEGKKDKIGTVGDLFTTLVREQQLLGTRVADLKGQLTQLLTGKDAVSSYFSSEVSNTIGEHVKKLDALEHDRLLNDSKWRDTVNNINERLDKLTSTSAGVETVQSLTFLLNTIVTRLENLEKRLPNVLQTNDTTASVGSTVAAQIPAQPNLSTLTVITPPAKSPLPPSASSVLPPSASCNVPPSAPSKLPPSASSKVPPSVPSKIPLLAPVRSNNTTVEGTHTPATYHGFNLNSELSVSESTDSDSDHKEKASDNNLPNHKHEEGMDEQEVENSLEDVEDGGDESKTEDDEHEPNPSPPKTRRRTQAQAQDGSHAAGNVPNTHDKSTGKRKAIASPEPTDSNKGKVNPKKKKV